MFLRRSCRTTVKPSARKSTDDNAQDSHAKDSKCVKPKLPKLPDPYKENVLVLLKSLYTGLSNDPSSTDKQEAQKAQNSLCFGEVLPEGVTKILDAEHLDAKNATMLIDLGMGLGKLAMQAWLTHQNLKTVIGLEFCESRAASGCAALQRLSTDAKPQDYSWRFEKDNAKQRIVESRSRLSKRSLEFRRGDLFETQAEIRKADIVICETKIRPERYPDFRELLNQIKLGGRLLTYEHLETVYRDQPFPFQAFAGGHRYLTSWAREDGHCFFVYRKV